MWWKDLQPAQVSHDGRSGFVEQDRHLPHTFCKPHLPWLQHGCLIRRLISYGRPIVQEGKVDHFDLHLILRWKPIQNCIIGWPCSHGSCAVTCSHIRSYQRISKSSAWLKNFPNLICCMIAQDPITLANLSLLKRRRKKVFVPNNLSVVEIETLTRPSR